MRRHIQFPEFLDARLRLLMKQHAHTRWKVRQRRPAAVTNTAAVSVCVLLTRLQALVQDMSEALQQSGR
jgi:hypothetical protein